MAFGGRHTVLVMRHAIVDDQVGEYFMPSRFHYESRHYTRCFTGSGDTVTAAGGRQ